MSDGLATVLVLLGFAALFVVNHFLGHIFQRWAARLAVHHDRHDTPDDTRETR